MLEVFKKYDIEEVLPFAVDPLLPNELVKNKIRRSSEEFQNSVYRNYDGNKVKMASWRYQVFKKSLKCVNCGIEGEYFQLERHIGDKSFHFNLYAELDGKPVLMTKDHIVPVSKGGKDEINNFQTMCSTCNGEKRNSKDYSRSFTDQKPRIATKGNIETLWGGRKDSFRCYMCGYRFQVGDYWRWVYTNNVEGASGNPIVCNCCDGEDVVERWKKLVNEVGEKYWWFVRR